MIFGKHINRYYLRYLPLLILGLFALLIVDYMQLVIPELYRNVINGIKAGEVTVAGVSYVFDLDFLLRSDSSFMPEPKKHMRHKNLPNIIAKITKRSGIQILSRRKSRSKT